MRPQVAATEMIDRQNGRKACSGQASKEVMCNLPAVLGLLRAVFGAALALALAALGTLFAGIIVRVPCIVLQLHSTAYDETRCASLHCKLLVNKVWPAFDLNQAHICTACVAQKQIGP